MDRYLEKIKVISTNGDYYIYLYQDNNPLPRVHSPKSTNG